MLVVGEQYSRVRAMWNDLGETVLTVPPGDPVAAIGLSDVPAAGSRFEVVKNEKTARALVEARNLEARPGMGTERPLTLEQLFTRAQHPDERPPQASARPLVHRLAPHHSDSRLKARSTSGADTGTLGTTATNTSRAAVPMLAHRAVPTPVVLAGDTARHRGPSHPSST